MRAQKISWPNGLVSGLRPFTLETQVLNPTITQMFLIMDGLL
jgi:hypothetical protein